jgi:SAM-dependent methyltransferase
VSDAVSLDGSPVEAYAAFPAEPELGVVRGLLAGRRRVLDLGCGTGRIADPLAVDGLDVVAVDESQEMLGHVRHAVALRGLIEDLNLGPNFDAVLLLSHLINGANAAALLDVAARHLVDGGMFVAQRLEPGRQWRTGSAQVGPVTVDLVDVVVEGQRVDASTSYSLGGRNWVQQWTLWERGDDEIEALLSAVGLRLTSVDGIWITATR